MGEVTIVKKENGDFDLKIKDSFIETSYVMDPGEAAKLRDDIVYEIKKESDQGVRVR